MTYLDQNISKGMVSDVPKYLDQNISEHGWGTLLFSM